MSTSIAFDASSDIVVGNIHVLAVSDGEYNMPATFFVDPTAFDQITDAHGQVKLPIGSFLIPGDEPILVDLGSRDADYKNKGYMFGGRLLEGLAAERHRPQDIRKIALTHLHHDHVGWLATPDGKEVFPNARVFVGEADWKHFVVDGPAERLEPHIRTMLQRLHSEGRLELLTDEVAISPAVTALPAPGHTPGHYVYAVQDSGEKLLILGDAAYCPAHLTNSDWDVMSDLNAPLARTTRASLGKQLEATNVSGVGCHFPHFTPARAVRMS